MRISSSQLHASAINSILDQQSALSRVQLQIASGRKVLTPSDDPAGAARALNLLESESSTGQYGRNVDIAESRLQFEEVSLTSVTNLIQRVRELTVQGNNDSNDAVSRKLIASEIRQRFDELFTLANTRDANNEYIFSGFQSTSESFIKNSDGSVSYNGDEGQRFLQIGASRQVATGDSGADVFGLIGSGNGQFTTRSSALNTGNATVGTGSIFNQNAYVADNYSVVLGDQTSVTGGTLAFNDDPATADTLQYELRINGTLVYTANEGDARTLAQIQADINGQVGTTNVRAYIDGGQLYLANTTPTATAITVNETLTGASDGATDTVTGFFGSNLTGAAATNDVVFNNADGYIVLDGSNGVVSSGAYVSGGNIDFNGQRLNISGTPSNGDRFVSSTNTEQDLFATLQTLVTQLEAPSTSIPAVPTTASLSSFTTAVAAGGGETLQVTIDGIDLVNVALAGGATRTAAQFDTDLATFIGANAGYSIVSGSFATNDLVLQKADGTDLVIAIPQNTTATPVALTGLTGTATNGFPAEGANTTVFHDALANVLNNLDRNLSNINEIRARVGARLNSTEDQTNINESSLLQVRETLSGIQDLDFAEAISQLEQQRTSLQAAQQSFVRIQSLSLFNFL